MRLANGIVIDKEKTFGVLKFSALRREVHVQNEDGTVSEEIKERTYDLKCNTQGRMIQVSVPAIQLCYNLVIAGITEFISTDFPDFLKRINNNEPCVLMICYKLHKLLFQSSI